MALSDPSADIKQIWFKIEYKDEGSGTWSQAGTFKCFIRHRATGITDYYVALNYVSGVDNAVVNAKRVTTTKNTANDLEPNRWIEPGDPEISHSTQYHLFPPGTHEIRVTFTNREKEGDVISAKLIFAGIEVSEDNAQKFANTAYIAATIPANQLTGQKPTITSMVAGRKIATYDGAAWTTRWSNNPMWILWDMLTNDRYGLALPTTQLDLPSFYAAATYCDGFIQNLSTDTIQDHWTDGEAGYIRIELNTDSEDLDCTGYFFAIDDVFISRRIIAHDRDTNQIILDEPIPTSPPIADLTYKIQEQRFRFDFIFDTRDSTETAIRRVLGHCRGIYWFDGPKIKVAIEQPTTSIGEIDELALVPAGDIISGMIDGSFDFKVKPNDVLPTAARYGFIDPEHNYRLRSLTIGVLETDREPVVLTYPGCVNPRQAERLAAYALNLAQATATISFATPSSALAVEPGDRVEIFATEPPLGYDLADPDIPSRLETGGDFLIVSRNRTPGNLSFAARQYDEDAYTDTANLVPPPRVNSQTPSPHIIPEPVADLTLQFLGDTSDDDIWNPWVRVSWTHPAPAGVNYWLIYTSEGTTGTWEQVAVHNFYTPYYLQTIGFVGTLKVKVIPFGHVHHSRWADSITASVVIDASLTVDQIISGEGSAGEAIDDAATRADWSLVEDDDGERPEDSATENTGDLADLDTVDTDEIDPGAVTHSHSTFSSSGSWITNTFVDRVTLSFTPERSDSLLTIEWGLHAETDVTDDDSIHLGTVECRLLRDTTNLKTIYKIAACYVDGTQAQRHRHMASDSFSHVSAENSPGTGTYTYKLQNRKNDTGIDTMAAYTSKAFIKITEHKR
jgi:hypothetical protein